MIAAWPDSGPLVETYVARLIVFRGESLLDAHCIDESRHEHVLCRTETSVKSGLRLEACLEREELP